ncbi:MAG: hypothetical protein ACRCZE_00395 [Candidatus Altimarinota bacterium]
MNYVENELVMPKPIKEMAKQNEDWLAIIEATKNEELKKSLEDLYEKAKTTFALVKNLNSDVGEELGEFKTENLEYFKVKSIFKDIRTRIYDLRKTGEDPELLAELEIESKKTLAKCHKEFEEARKEALEYVDVDRKLEQIRAKFPEFYETAKHLQGAVSTYNGRYHIPKFHNMPIPHFYGKINDLLALTEDITAIIEDDELSQEKQTARQTKALKLLTTDSVDLDDVARVFFKRLRERGIEKMERVTKKLQEIGLKGPLVRQYSNNKFDVSLIYGKNNIQITWHALGLFPTLKSNLRVENMKEQSGSFEINLSNEEDENELVQKVAEMVEKLEG